MNPRKYLQRSKWLDSSFERNEVIPTPTTLDELAWCQQWGMEFRTVNGELRFVNASEANPDVPHLNMDYPLGRDPFIVKRLDRHEFIGASATWLDECGVLVDRFPSDPEPQFHHFDITFARTGHRSSVVMDGKKLKGVKSCWAGADVNGATVVCIEFVAPTADIETVDDQGLPLDVVETTDFGAETKTYGVPLHPRNALPPLHKREVGAAIHETQR